LARRTELHVRTALKETGPPLLQTLCDTGKCGNSSYRLQLLKTWKIFSVFNKALLTPFTPSSFPSQETNYKQPPPEIINDDEQYEIEEIVDSRR